MNQTSYKGTNNLVKRAPLTGGICKFWYIPIEEVQSFPEVDPQNQFLKTDVVLKSGKFWRGPVPVPDKQLGLKETKKAGKSGPYHEIKVSAMYPGELAAGRVNLENMCWQQFLIVAQLRASQAYVLIGNEDAGMEFGFDYDSGSAAGNAVITKLEWSIEQPYRAQVLTTFNGAQSGYINFDGETTVVDNNWWELE